MNIENLQKALDERTGEIAQLTKLILDSEKKLVVAKEREASLTKSLDAATKKVATKDDELKKLSAEISTLNARLEKEFADNRRKMTALKKLCAETMFMLFGNSDEIKKLVDERLKEIISLKK